MKKTRQNMFIHVLGFFMYIRFEDEKKYLRIYS